MSGERTKALAENVTSPTRSSRRWSSMLLSPPAAAPARVGATSVAVMERETSSAIATSMPRRISGCSAVPTLRPRQRQRDQRHRCQQQHGAQAPPPRAAAATQPVVAAEGGVGSAVAGGHVGGGGGHRRQRQQGRAGRGAWRTRSRVPSQRGGAQPRLHGDQRQRRGGEPRRELAEAGETSLADAAALQLADRPVRLRELLLGGGVVVGGVGDARDAAQRGLVPRPRCRLSAPPRPGSRWGRRGRRALSRSAPRPAAPPRRSCSGRR